MAKKDIDLALLAKVTGKKAPATAPPAPLPATPATPATSQALPDGVTGTPPLPAGKLVGAILPEHVAPDDLDTLRKFGWRDDVPLPSNTASLLEEAQRRLNMVDPLPVDPRTPALQVTTRDLADLPPADQARFREALRASAVHEAARQQATQPLPLASQVPGLADAVRVADQVAEQASTDSFEVTHGSAAKTAAGSAVKTPAAAPAVAAAASGAPSVAQTPPAAVEKASESGAALKPAYCPHCDWDLNQTDIPEPPHADKMAFLHALLGEKPWYKTYDLFGGEVEASFRTLTVLEVEACYRQAYIDRKNGEIPEEVDYYERLNRYRLMLQLVGFKNHAQGGFDHSLPEGYSKEANPNAETFWNLAEELQEPGSTKLPLITTYIRDNVLKTEATWRIVSNKCNEFNRLVVKMEAMADNSDFWRTTEAPS